VAYLELFEVTLCEYCYNDLLFLAGMSDKYFLADQGHIFLASSASRAEQLVGSLGGRLQFLSPQPSSVPVPNPGPVQGPR
jgi:hypothetical protein